MPSEISEVMIYSLALCEREESPGPILMASQLTRIQSEVVGEEYVPIPRSSAVLRRGDSGAVAEDLLVRFLAFRVLLHTAWSISVISSLVYCSVGLMSTTKVHRSGITLWAFPPSIWVTFSITSHMIGECFPNLNARRVEMSSMAMYKAFTPSPRAACPLTPCASASMTRSPRSLVAARIPVGSPTIIQSGTGYPSSESKSPPFENIQRVPSFPEHSSSRERISMRLNGRNIKKKWRNAAIIDTT